MSEAFCSELASALAVMLLELNAELEDFAEQVEINTTSADLDAAVESVL